MSRYTELRDKYDDLLRDYRKLETKLATAVSERESTVRRLKVQLTKAWQLLSEWRNTPRDVCQRSLAWRTDKVLAGTSVEQLMNPEVKKVTDDYRVRLILTEIEASDTHCSNDCPGISPESSFCFMFKEDLAWDDEKTENGRVRLTVCKEAEMRASEKNANPEQGDGCTRYGCPLSPGYRLRWKSKGHSGPVYALCCGEHLEDTLQTYRADVDGESFLLSRIDL